MPPALSVIGPNESIATTMPAIESIDMTAIATPYKPAKPFATKMPTTMTMPGSAVACIDTARPAMMFVA